MARVLLVADRDSSDAAGITYVLVRDRHNVTLAKNLDDPHLFSDGNLQYQILIVDLTRNRPSDWRNLDDALTAITPAHTSRKKDLVQRCRSAQHYFDAIRIAATGLGNLSSQHRIGTFTHRGVIGPKCRDYRLRVC